MAKDAGVLSLAVLIDAMDLMHKGRLDGFCLVSSDSDFTRLAQRLREDGLVVYGFGERKTPEAFRSACNRFLYLENLGSGTEKESGAAAPEEAERKEPPSRAVKLIARALEDADEEGWMNLGSVGSRILGAVPDFDARTYGCRNLVTLVEKSGGFEVDKDQTYNVRIRRKAPRRKTAGKARTRRS